MTDIYADGIGNVRLAGTNARIDLLVVGAHKFTMRRARGLHDSCNYNICNILLMNSI